MVNYNFDIFDVNKQIQWTTQANNALQLVTNTQARAAYQAMAAAYFYDRYCEQHLISNMITEGYVFQQFAAFARQFNFEYAAVESEIFTLHETTTNTNGKQKQTNYSYKAGSTPQSQGIYNENGTENDAVTNSSTTEREQYDATAMKEQGDFMKFMDNKFNYVLRRCV